jgi:hypothetical protein
VAALWTVQFDAHPQAGVVLRICGSGGLWWSASLRHRTHVLAEVGDVVDYPVVDLTQPQPDQTPGSAPTGQSFVATGSVNGAEVAASIEELRAELSQRITSSPEGGLKLSELTVKLTITAEGKVAFVAKGGIEASIEAKFTWQS